MTALQAMARALDRPGGRRLLAQAATAYLRTVLKRDIAVLYNDGLWMHKSGRWTFPDSRFFSYDLTRARRWLEEPDVYFRNAKSWWYKLYHPREGDTILDIGAGRGEDALPFSQGVGKLGRVISVEAHPWSFHLLSTFCKLNSLENVLPIHAAIADTPRHMYVVESADGDWQSDHVSDTPGGRVIDGQTIDQLCRDLGIRDIAFLKMNIEGAERLALTGMSETISRVRCVCICAHDFRANRGDGEWFRTRSVVCDFLQSNGFKISEFEGLPDWQRDHIHARQ
jgi:FkbM family methyltransferase